MKPKPIPGQLIGPRHPIFYQPFDRHRRLLRPSSHGRHLLPPRTAPPPRATAAAPSSLPPPPSSRLLPLLPRHGSGPALIPRDAHGGTRSVEDEGEFRDADDGASTDPPPSSLLASTPAKPKPTAAPLVASEGGC
jgi:hypothetical protein